MSEFYTIETPPSSISTSKDSMDDTITLISKKKQMKLFLNSQRDEFGSIFHDEMNAPLRRSLGNTKLKTRQDVRRFRKFLKRNHNIISTSLVDIEPDAMRRYLIDYLTSIRTRKGLKYDPETLRSYYLSIQRFLKDSNYPCCLRNSPQFAQCRDLIIQMRKEKNQIKLNDLASLQNKGMLKKTPVNEKQSNRINYNSTEILPTTTYIDLLPSSSLPPRKRQQMKYFLESNIPCDLLFVTSISRSSSYSLPSSVLSFDAYLILMKFTSSSIKSSQNMLSSFEKFLDESPACGNKQRTMLTTLCHQWTGDIRIIHANLRPEISSFLPHILLINILAKKY